MPILGRHRNAACRGGAGDTGTIDDDPSYRTGRVLVNASLQYLGITWSFLYGVLLFERPDHRARALGHGPDRDGGHRRRAVARIYRARQPR